jgi:hypothetical protein
MGLLKSELTAQLDDVTRVASETLALYEDFETRVESRELKTLLQVQWSKQRRFLEDIATFRRRHGALPKAGDPEHSHLEAAAAHLRARFLPGDTDFRYVESVLDACSELDAEIDEALGAGPTPELEAMLERFKDDNAEFERGLRTVAAALTK